MSDFNINKKNDISKKKITVMIQARRASTRLPNKVLAKIEKKSMIWHIINRVKKIKSVQQIALITTKEQEDKILLKIAKKNGVIGFAGMTSDVLDRHYQCAKMFNADPIIRITSDCPLVDPVIVEKILQFYLKNKYDFVSNAIIPTYPDGIDVEIFSFEALEKASKKAKKSYDREHVTTYFIKHPNQFKVFNYQNDEDLASLRWTVDRENDLKFIRKIYSKMRPKTIFFMNDVLKVIRNDPKILETNKGIKRNEGHLKSTYTK